MKDACHDFASRSDPVGELLLRHGRDHIRSLGGIKQLANDTLAH
ncbi:MAG TPA: hypothetical protein VIF32_04025 [Gemmatimonadaceae bacterium]